MKVFKLRQDMVIGQATAEIWRCFIFPRWQPTADTCLFVLLQMQVKSHIADTHTVVVE